MRKGKGGKKDSPDIRVRRLNSREKGDSLNILKKEDGGSRKRGGPRFANTTLREEGGTDAKRRREG